jgi:hypothetical protein
VKVLIFIALLTGLALALLSRADYSFYNPRKGVAAVGVADTPADAHAREVLEHRITAADSAWLGRTPTLRRLTDFYGTSDALLCSVRRTFKTSDLAAAMRPLGPGTLVRLCLN